MSIVAIIGAGALGGALAHSLAGRNRVDEVRLIDPEGRIAEGKALDILEASPIEQFSTRITAAATLAACAGADVIVLADLAAGGEIAGEPGLALLRQIVRLETSSPLLFAGGAQLDLMARAAGELHVPARRLIGSAPFALESAVRAVTAALLDASPADLAICIAGVPPRDAVIAWSAATAFRQPIAAVLAAHQQAAITSRLPALWPPSPYALASAAARIAESLANASRRRYTCFASLDGKDRRGAIAAVPVQIAKGGIERTLDPALSPHERTVFENGFGYAS